MLQKPPFVKQQIFSYSLRQSPDFSGAIETHRNLVTMASVLVVCTVLEHQVWKLRITASANVIPCMHHVLGFSVKSGAIVCKGLRIVFRVTAHHQHARNSEIVVLLQYMSLNIQLQSVVHPCTVRDVRDRWTHGLV